MFAKITSRAIETKLKEETMNGSLLVAYCCTTIFPCYMSLEINQSMQGPNGHYDKDYRVGQLPSLLGNMQIYNFPLTAEGSLLLLQSPQKYTK